MKQIKLFFFVLFLSSCYPGNLALQRYNTAFNLPSVGDSSSPSSSEYFYFDIDEAQYRSERQIPPYYEISTTEEYGDGERNKNSRSNCEILLNLIEEEEDFSLSESSETLICILDLLEGDIQAKDLHLTFNFPEGMCSYVRTGLPWHFNYEIIPGPRTAKCQSTTGTGDDEETEDLFCDATQPGCAEGDDTQTCPSGSVEEEEDLCSLEKPLCCYGGLKEDGEEWEPDLECYAGPALIAEGDTALPAGEFYKYLVRELPEGGLRESFTLPHGIGIHGGQRSSLTHANYIKILDRSPEDLRNLERGSLPDFLQEGFFHLPPRLFFEFDCLDAGSESLHKILVMIREWNTLEEFWDFYLDGGNDSADPDITGIEGDDCPYEDRRILEDDLAACNDHFDMDDIDDFEDDAFPEVESWLGYFGTTYPNFDYDPESE